jgi:hypothetical protein
MAALVDCNIGRKVAPFMMSLGFQDVHVEMETDTLFTVIGSIDAERRWNWEKQFQAARPHLLKSWDRNWTRIDLSIVSSHTMTIPRPAASLHYILRGAA